MGLCFTPSALALKIDQASYRYPYPDPYLATMTVALMQGHEDRAASRIRDLDIRILPDRNDIYLLQGKGKLRVRFYQQDGPAPLIFIIPGLGSSAYAGSARYIAEFLVEQGFHALILPSPFNWNFTLAASISGFPGFTPADSKDLYSAMGIVLNDIIARYHPKIGKIGLLGFSNGALNAAFLSKLDSEQKKIGFKTTLLINPPVDLLEGIRKVDQMARLGKEWTDEQRKYIEAYAFGVVTDALKKDIDEPDYFADWNRRLRLTEKQMKYLIGGELQSAVGDTLYLMSLIQPLPPLETPISWGNRSGRLRKARSYGLMDYLEIFLIPRLIQLSDKQMNLERLNVQTSLKGVARFLKNNKTVFLLHNRDDFLVSSEDLDYLEALFGERAKIYPDGGHLGNLWYPQNQKDIVNVFRPLLQ